MPTLTPEQERIRSYLTAQAAKLDPPAIIDKVRAAMAELAAAAAAVPPARFGERPSQDEWSANDVMAHVLAAGQRFGGDVLSVLDGQPLAAHAPGADEARGPAPERSAEAWCRMLASARSAVFDRALAADPGARLDRVIEHGMFGALNWRETLLFLRLHDLDHAGQLRAIAAAMTPAAGGALPPP